MTIYALSTGPGISGLAVIRVSGKNTADVVKKLTDFCIHYPVSDMQIAEDLHMSLGHILMKKLCSD